MKPFFTGEELSSIEIKNMTKKEGFFIQTSKLFTNILTP
jgi:hypothetical protein